ncbi:hypothetical protein ACFC06_23065 [Nocardia sp. NPDC056064]|uniref:hypothetical protein n=1 Tax=Nocardia sp. NPDC056064 TaxID=3345701 RepID=UPI0035DDDC82
MEHEQFGQEALASVRAHWAGAAEYSAEDFSVSIDDGRVIYLGNIFRECSDLGPSERAASLAAFVSAMIFDDEVPVDWRSVRPMLRSVLRPVTLGTDLSSALSRPAFPFVNESVVIDRPRTRAFVHENHARDWGVEPDEVFAAARENLAALARPGSAERLQVTRFIDDGSSYAASWLLVPGWLAGHADGTHRPVVFIAENDSLLLVPDEPDLLAQTFEMIEQQYREAARPISPQGYTIDAEGTVVPFDEAGEHPCRRLALRARAGLALTEYSIQSNHLDKTFEEFLELPDLGIEPAYVSSVNYEESNRGAFTSVVWGEDVDYLLPEADVVHFLRRDKNDDVESVCTVPFPTVIEILGLVPVPGLSPTRFEVRGWPDPAAMTRLRAAAIEP